LHSLPRPAKEGRQTTLERMVKRTMNGKRLLILAAFAALASFAMPAALTANTLSNTASVTVKWNTQALGSLVLHTNYLASSGINNASAQYVGKAGGGNCTATGGGNIDGTVDFGIVSASPTVTTNCQFANAVNAIITSNDPTGYILSDELAASIGTYNLCLTENGSWANNNTLPTNSSILPAGAALAQTASCSLGTSFPVAVSTYNQIFTAAAATATTELGMDINLILPAAATVGATSATLNYQLILN